MKTILISLLILLFLSCGEEYNQYKNGQETGSKIWENRKPTYLEGLYSNSEGTIIFMSDRVSINTPNHYHEFKYSEYMNALIYCNEEITDWYIRVNDNDYRFNVDKDVTIFYFKRDKDKDFTRVGVFYKDYQQPIIEN